MLTERIKKHLRQLSPHVAVRGGSVLLAEALAEIERLRSWIEPECPCCLGAMDCEEGCTFAKDAPQDYEFMQETRSFLNGK